MNVAVVGSINTDVVARVPHIPRPGETLLAHDSSRGGGGKGANQAVAAARAGGASVAFVGAVGQDADGETLRAALEADGIDVSGLALAPQPTGVALISVAEDGENAIVVIPGANATGALMTDRQRELVSRADVVAAQLEIPVARVLEASALRAPDAIFVLNASPSAPFADTALAGRLLAATDILVVNEHELHDIAGQETDLAIDSLTGQVAALIVTLGAAGAIVAMAGERRRVPAFAVQPVDTTGAGDTYCGVLSAHLPSRAFLTIEALAAAARVAAAAAALAVGRPGAQASVPTTAEVDRFLEEAP